LQFRNSDIIAQEKSKCKCFVKKSLKS